LGRRDPETNPDIGLAPVRASRRHALLLRDWIGRVFLMDLGSPNGTFMDNGKLVPKQIVEWQVGSSVYFAAPSPEIFELRLYHRS